MTKNTVYTINEYMEQGFTKEEAYVVRRLDIMHNQWNDLTEKQKERYFIMSERLGLQKKKLASLPYKANLQGLKKEA